MFKQAIKAILYFGGIHTCPLWCRPSPSTPSWARWIFLILLSPQPMMEEKRDLCTSSHSWRMIKLSLLCPTLNMGRCFRKSFFLRPWSLLSHSLSWLSSGLLTHLSLCANMVSSLLSPSFSFLSLRSDLFETEWRALSHFAGTFFRLRRPPTTEILRHRLIYSYSSCLCCTHGRRERQFVRFEL